MVAYYGTMKPFYDKALADVKWSLGTFAEKNFDQEQKRVWNSSIIRERVKPQDSLWRKCLRDGIIETSQIPSSVEDILGIRTSAPK